MNYILEYRKLIKITGIDNVRFLQNILSNDIKDINAEKMQYSLLLTPKGKILYDFFIFRSLDEFYLDCHKDYIKEAIESLTMYKLHYKVNISSIKSNVYISNEILHKYCFIDPRCSKLGYRSYDLYSTSQTYDSDPSIKNNYNHNRLIHLVPEFNFDFISRRFFPLDLRMDKINAISFKKGCFLGQEVTAIMNYRSKRKKSLKCINLKEYKILDNYLIKDSIKVGIVLGIYKEKALALLKG